MLTDSYKIQKILDRFKEKLEAIAHRCGDDARNKAERTLNAAIAASKETMMNMMQEGALTMAEASVNKLPYRSANLAVLPP